MTAFPNSLPFFKVQFSYCRVTLCLNEIKAAVQNQWVHLREGDAKGHSSDDPHVALDEGRH